MHFVIGNLVNFYLGDPLGKLWMVLAFWLFWPGLMFVVGWIGESRLVPAWKNQAKAFIPGDLTLGVMAVALLGLHVDTYGDPSWWGYSPFWWVAVAVTMAIVAVRVHNGDAANYPPRSGISPTKITHDVVGYFLIPVILIGLGVPELVHDIAQGAWVLHLTNWGVLIAAVAFYVGCASYDAIIHIKGYEMREILARHPEDWQPIWHK